MRTTSVLICVMMAREVPAGANNALQFEYSKPGYPDSATVGTSGADAVRCALLTAIPLRRPARTCGNTEGMLTKSMCTWPAIKSVMAGASFVRHVHDVDPGRKLEQLETQVRRSARPGGGKVELIRFAFGGG